jgi:hypothetical protein
MGYARTFQKLFGGIFGWRKPKPWLRKVGGFWLCYGSHYGACGDTPEEAYFAWLDDVDNDTTKGGV